jgi:hypothetical protein
MTLLWYAFHVPPKRSLRKIIDEINPVRCVAGPGVIREEAWEDEFGTVVRYNLAFINHFLTSADNGRVLGYDNAHGEHHRHFYGAVEQISFTGFRVLAEMFYDEVDVLKGKMR